MDYVTSELELVDNTDYHSIGRSIVTTTIARMRNEGKIGGSLETQSNNRGSVRGIIGALRERVWPSERGFEIADDAPRTATGHAATVFATLAGIALFFKFQKVDWAILVGSLALAQIIHF